MPLSNYASTTHNINNFSGSQYPSANTQAYSSNVAIRATSFTSAYAVLNFANVTFVAAATSPAARPKSGMLFPRFVR
jgi:hypothetical protein